MARDDGNRTCEIRAGQAAKKAMAQVKALTGREPLAVASLEPLEDGWRVGVEVLEDARVPSSGDILALYEAEIGLDGELLSYHRARRYRRGDTGDGTGGP